MEKDCTKCGVSKPLEMFGKHKNGIHGRNSECKKCQAKRDKANKDKKKDKIKEYNKLYNQTNKEAILEYNKQYLKKRYKKDPI